MRKLVLILVIVFMAAMLSSIASADTLVYKNGTTLNNCFILDDATNFLVWEKLADIGTTNYKVIPRSEVKEPIQQSRDAAWDVHPPLPDLTITFIEMNPKLAGLHWQIQYDDLNTPTIGGPKILVDQGDEQNRMNPEGAVKNLKLKYKPGEEVTLTAHVKNVGFKDSKPFDFVWMIDGKEVAKGKYAKAAKELEELTFQYKYKWVEGKHDVTFKITTVQPEISVLNNQVTDALYGWGFTFVINKGRTYHQQRNAVGTFCFEDYYRFHVDIMNTLFKASIYPSAPDGIQARVRLDRIVYCDDPNGDKNMQYVRAADGIGYIQGMWTWTDQPGEIEKGWPMADYMRWGTEWSLPHELGHQLGIPDWYCQDNYGSKDHVWPDNGEVVCHLMTHPNAMQHNHGPYPWNEADAGYWNANWDKPRGYYGDYMFNVPDENFIRVVDINGLAVPDAKIEIYQRAVTVDATATPTVDQGVKVYPVNELAGGNDQSKDPVMVGTTDQDGIMRLPNRPAREVITLNGSHRKNNPFGNIDCVGPRDQMLMKVTKFDNPCYYWLELFNFNVAYYRGQNNYTTVVKTPYRSASSPLAPVNVKFEQVDPTHVKVTWDAPKVIHEQQYLDRVIGYKVYRRVGCMGLDDRPWFSVASLNPDTKECIIDLTERPIDNGFYAQTERYAVSSLGELSMESELVAAPIPQVTP
jgi:hypothetical protein